MAKSARTALAPTKDKTSLAPKMLTKQEFGRRVYELMIKKDWNQSDLARHANLGRDSISTYVRGKALPDPRNLQRLAKALGVEASALLPNTMESAIDAEHPAFEIKMAHGDPGKVWLKVNRMVMAPTATKIFDLIQKDDEAMAAETMNDDV